MKKEREIILELERLAVELTECASKADGLQQTLLDMAVHFTWRASLEVAKAVISAQIKVEVSDGTQTNLRDGTAGAASAAS